MSGFFEEYPSDESIWRAIILFGRNVASYKFALGKSLIELAADDKTFVSLDELAVPFSKYLTEHLKVCDKQVTSKSSKFLDTCRSYNEGKIDHDALVATTARIGFVNVIDAFHIVGDNEVPVRFFQDERKGPKKGITITDDLLKLKESFQFQNLPMEVEARWNLVETAWTLGVSSRLLEVGYDGETELLVNPYLERRTITSCRDALNGYQKGKCFYCFDDISVKSGSSKLAHVDHFFPHILKPYMLNINIDGVWNLVLACQKCNSGSNGKFAKLPQIKFLDRLNKRNNFLISSHHPLRQTLVLQMGQGETERKGFLQMVDKDAINLLIHRWAPENEFAPWF